MLYVELQHHKVTPYPLFFQASSLQPMTHHQVCGDVTPCYPPPCSDQKFDIRLIDLIQSKGGGLLLSTEICFLFKQMVWYYRPTGKNPAVRSGCLICLARIAFFSCYMPIVDQLHGFPPAFDGTSLTFVCSMWMKCGAQTCNGITRRARPRHNETCRKTHASNFLLTSSVFRQNQWCSWKRKRWVISRPLDGDHHEVKRR